MGYSETISGIINDCDAKDLVEAKALVEELNDLLSEFRGFDSPGYDRSIYERLLERFESFERSVNSLEYMVFFYSYIGRSALNAQNIKKATMYALASVEVCEMKNDLEGISSSRMLLCDIALSVGSTVWAAHFYKLAKATMTIPFEIEKDEHTDSVFKKLSSLKRRPSSYRFMFDPELMQREYVIRLRMKAMHVSRTTAERYAKLYKGK